ncbi:MAG TPA: hypothetical protein VK638_41100 [Edaphobacter sp.]|nr:hypothetical protein [Edaphobacter sp.]
MGPRLLPLTVSNRLFKSADTVGDENFADRTTDGVLVVSSDNKTILFKTNFLYRNRNANGNEDYTDTADMLD